MQSRGKTLLGMALPNCFSRLLFSSLKKLCKIIMKEKLLPILQRLLISFIAPPTLELSLGLKVMPLMFCKNSLPHIYCKHKRAIIILHLIHIKTTDPCIELHRVKHIKHFCFSPLPHTIWGKFHFAYFIWIQNPPVEICDVKQTIPVIQLFN